MGSEELPPSGEVLDIEHPWLSVAFFFAGADGSPAAAGSRSAVSPDEAGGSE